jgi:hypothetical protein
MDDKVDNQLFRSNSNHRFKRFVAPGGKALLDYGSRTESLLGRQWLTA